MNTPITPIDVRASFRFSCSPDVACFNACCRDLNQALTPYDVMRLKNHLDLDSGQFLDRFIALASGPQTGLPVASLRFADQPDRACPFVTPTGCSVYPARPASCRTYPLARAVARCRQTGRCKEHFATISEPHCLGWQSAHRQTVRQWIADQQLVPYHQGNDAMLELISLKNRRRPGPLPTALFEQVAQALYHLDGFRARMAAPDCHPALKRAMRDGDILQCSDDTLLALALQWVNYLLFGRRVMPIPEKRRTADAD